MIGEAEGYNPRKEAWAPNKETRADVLLTGTLTIAYEHQHSPFSSTARYSAPERTRRAEAVGRTVMWHANSREVRGLVPILRTDNGLPPKVIENLNYRHEFRGGLFRIEIYTCTVRDGHDCPGRKFSGCGKPHARGQVTAVQLDDVLRGAPVGAYMPLVDAKVIRAPKFFWTDRQSYDQYVMHVAGSDAVSLLAGLPANQGRTRNGARDGHSRAKEVEFEALHVQAVDLSALAAPSPRRFVAPANPRPAAGQCSQWIGAESRYCQLRDAVRRYVQGFRCPDHAPGPTPSAPPALQEEDAHAMGPSR